MITHETTLRVRYAETDQMGVVYHGHFLAYFEAARGDMIRDFGLSYADLEAGGLLMPVTEVRLKYMRPVKYDTLITLRCTIQTWPQRRLAVKTEVFDPAGKRCVEGTVELAFIDRHSGKTIDAPGFFLDILKTKWQESNS
jgi:acyl-CoA thioester hydrolase